MNRCWIGLGSNMGDREGFLMQALRQLSNHKGIQLARYSSIYETEPYGPVSQDHFLNMVVEIHTMLEPTELLSETQAIEANLQRERTIHWGPRTIDLDILLYADKIIKMDALKIPHPELSKRLFVLVPMKELEKNLEIPGLNKTIQELSESFKDQKGVRLWKQKSGGAESEPFEN